MSVTRRVNIILHSVIVFMAAMTALAPVYGAFAEIQATPIIDTTPTPTEVAATQEPASTAVPAMDPTSAGTPAATEVQPASLISPNAIVEGPGTSLHNCAQSSEVVTPNFPIRVSCDFTLRGPGGLGDILAIIYGRVDAPTNLPYGFSVDIKITPKSLGQGSDLINSKVGGFAISHFGEVLLGGSITSRVEIVIKVSEAAIPLASFSAVFSSCRAATLVSTACLSGSNRQGGSVTVTGSVDDANLVPGVHFFLECEQPAAGGVSFEQVAVAECTVSSDVGTRAIRVDEIVTTIDDPGAWSVTVANTSGDPLDFQSGTSLLQAPVEVGDNSPYVFQIRMTPTTCSAGEKQLPVGVNIGVVPLHSGEVVGPIAGSVDPIGLGVAFDPPTTSANIANLSVTDPGAVPYSMTSDTEDLFGRMTFTYTVSGCGPWKAHAKISSFTKEDHGGYTGSVPRLVRMRHVSTHVGVIDHPLDPPIAATWTPLLTGNDPGAVPVDYEHTIELEYIIPANTPVGEYKSTIIVSTSADAP